MPIVPLVINRSDPAWKNTFNGTLGSYGLVDDIVKAAREAKYPYFIVGDSNVYVTPARGSWADRVCAVSDLDDPRTPAQIEEAFRAECRRNSTDFSNIPPASADENAPS